MLEYEEGTIMKTLLKKVLRNNNYSVTVVRQFVFELLLDHEPQSMHELADRAKGQVDRASLYRTIGLFENLGIAQRVYVGWKYKVELTDIFDHHHHHLSCLSCSKLVALKEDDAIERLIHSLAEANGMTAERHQLEIQGYCQACRANKA